MHLPSSEAPVRRDAEARVPRGGGLRITLIALLACAVTLISGAAVLGYALDIDAAFGWGVYARMTLPTGIAFLIIGSVTLAWSWRKAQSSGIDLARWLPAGASVTVMAMVALGCSISLSELQTAISWRKHSYEVLVTSQGLLGDLVDTQRGMRGYVLTGQADALRLYRTGATRARHTVAALGSLTRDNAAQQARIKMLATDVQAALAYAHRLIRVHDTEGLEAAMRLETTGGGLRVMDDLRADLQNFTGAERELLVMREAAAERNFRGTTALVIAGSALAVILLALAHFLGDRELVRRRRADEKLRESLALDVQRLAELRLSEERFRRAFDDAPIGMALVSPSGRWLKVNRALCEMLGLASEDFLKRDVQSITHPGDWGASARLMERTLAGELPGYQVEKRYVSAGGGIVDARVSVSLARGHAGEPLYFIAQVEDVSHRRQMDRMKREFISTVSHELRTPLTSIRGSLGLVAAGVLGPMPEKAQSMVRIAHQNSERLVRIINDILDIEKIEAGKLDLRVARVALAPLLTQALETNQAYADKYQVRLVLEPLQTGDDVLADPDRLMQVMANLLSNAAKFSPAGAEVCVRASRRGDRVRFEVEDHGTGIPEEFCGRVFEKFAQADGSSSRRFEGTGLGLSITRQLVEAMGGTIGFETATGKGTTFHFELPCAQPRSAAPPAAEGLSNTARLRVLLCRDELDAASEGGPKPRILHVEDDLDLSRVIGAALDDRAEIVAAPTLKEAQRLLRDESFALVVLDLKLPDGDGLTLLDRMANLAKNPPPVVVLSVAEVPHEMKQRVAAALVKSRVSESHIIETILSLVRGETPPSRA